VNSRRDQAIEMTQKILEVRRLDSEEFEKLVRDSSEEGPLNVAQDDNSSS